MTDVHYSIERDELAEKDALGAWHVVYVPNGVVVARCDTFGDAYTVARALDRCERIPARKEHDR